MLRQLRIQNVILIESADILFQEGLNVLSGETGSGKSAIMEALSLVLGERSDPNLIRKGCDKGVIEALFDIENLPKVRMLLEEAGIDTSENELLIKREIASNGKSKAYINHQTAQLHLLKTIGEPLIDIVGQHANQRLRTPEKHRELVDSYGHLEDLRNGFQSAWNDENRIRKKLSDLIESEGKRLRDIEVCKMEIEELSEAKLKEGEDEQLFSQYTLMSNAQELSDALEGATKLLSGEKGAILPALGRLKICFDTLQKIDSGFNDSSKTVENSLLELQEVSYSLQAYQSRIDFRPEHIEKINDRLSLINKLKRKYGSTLAEILTYQETAKEKLNSLENADIEIEELKNELKAAEEKASALALELRKKRIATASNLQKVITQQLKSLNMPKVDFQIEVAEAKRGPSGDDKVEFFMAPNVGERLSPIKDCASGGELSRVLLALQTALAGKEQIATLVFDEIDANIGGETATAIGEKLSEIAQKHQVLCITHFPQVAKRAEHHLQISKREVGGRTITCITVLDSLMREKELARMLGG